MNAIGVRIEFLNQKFPDLLKQARAGQLQMWGIGEHGRLRRKDSASSGCSTDPMPDSRTSPRFNLPQFNELYDKGKHMKNGPERDKVITQALEAGQHLFADEDDSLPVRQRAAAAVDDRIQVHAVQLESWRYWDLDPALREAMLNR